MCRSCLIRTRPCRTSPGWSTSRCATATGARDGCPTRATPIATRRSTPRAPRRRSAESIITHKLPVTLAEAASVGLDFRGYEQRRMSPTVNSLRLLHFGRAAGREAEVVEQIFAQHFVGGKDTGDLEVLADCAAAAGLDREAVRRGRCVRCGVPVSRAADRRPPPARTQGGAARHGRGARLGAVRGSAGPPVAARVWRSDVHSAQYRRRRRAGAQRRGAGRPLAGGDRRAAHARRRCIREAGDDRVGVQHDASLFATCTVHLPLATRHPPPPKPAATSFVHARARPLVLVV